MPLSLEQFAQELQQSVLADASVDGTEGFTEDVFTRRMLEELAEAGEVGDGEVCHYEGVGGRGRILKINGFISDYENERLDLAVSIYTGAGVPTRVEKGRVDAAFRQAAAFMQSSLDGLYVRMEESSPAFGLAQLIHSLNQTGSPFSRLRVFLLTDGIVSTAAPADEKIAGLPVTHHIRDLAWFQRLFVSGHTPDKIEINFVERPGGAVPCLPMPTANDEYQTFLTIVSGELLFSIYKDYSARLLERNVRSFLQAKGGVNKGIRETLKTQPQRFLAYNNGLTATAEAVHLSSDGRAIERVVDLQIVNGGQTTASIFASHRDHADLSQVFVQMKLSVVHDPAKLDDFVGKIAEYANSQNKVNIADFSANHPFHRKIEELSRTVWAPPKAGSQTQTHWFYERARGQFAEARSRENTPAKKKVWDALHPRKQMFTKTDLAKFENTWMQRPHLVSRGAQTNFAEFAMQLRRNSSAEPDAPYFRHLIAKAILFRRAEEIVSAQHFGGYRANIVTYTLAYLSHATKQCIDLEAVWKAQDISPALQLAIENISKYVHEYITAPPGGANVTQWCKRESCWQGFKGQEITLPAALSDELITFGRGTYGSHSTSERTKPNGSGFEGSTEEIEPEIAAACEVPSDVWLLLSSWAKATDNLQGYQRGIAYSIGDLLRKGKRPSKKQALNGLQALAEAKELGFEGGR